MTTAPAATAVLRVCFVCTGNICRSPMAEQVFRARLAEAGLEGRVEVDSAGTGGWHEGKGADHTPPPTGSMAVLHSYERAAELFAAGVLDPGVFISDRLPLTDYAHALDRFRAGQGRKIQVVP